MNNDINDKIVHAAPVPPFVTFVASAVPMVFDNSMSYYEALCALWKWLQDDVIDVINNNATVTEQYIEYDLHTRELFIELKSYVDNYFDNLDVQEEINNKLDEMVEDGTLQQLIASYLQTQIIYDTTEAMIADAEHLVNGVRVETLGYRAVDDAGAAFFVIKDTGTANGYSVIDLENGLYAHMINLNDTVRPEQFGAYGDGVNDHNDSDAIQFAIDSGKIVELSPKTYICYSLTIESPVTIHGNGAILKRPELDIAPYSMSVNDMKWIRTFTIQEDCDIDGITFDNNCFTMWQVSDGYTQEQSASVIAGNSTKKIKLNLSDCHFKNSAGDGLHIVQNVIANISNCTSEDCFRGGITTTGYGSEINVNGWNSRVITAGVNDGIDVEVDTASTVDANTFTLNINNMELDYDLDIAVPQYGVVNLNNVVMRSFDTTLYNGFTCNVSGVLNVFNSVIRRGIPSGTVNQRCTRGGQIRFTNCEIYGHASQDLFRYATPADTRTGEEQLVLDNCKVKCYNLIELAIVSGYIRILNSVIECTNSLVVKAGNVSPQPNHFIVSNTSIKFGTVLLEVTKTASATFADGVNIHLDNLHLISDESDTEILCSGGKPFIRYSGLICDTPLKPHNTYGGSPIYIGNNRIVTVATATDFTFAGWVAGNDIGIARDTGTRYQYTSGTTWTAI